MAAVRQLCDEAPRRGPFVQLQPRTRHGVPGIAVAVSPREWAPSLLRHVMRHGGALVRARPMGMGEALDEDYVVLVCEDTTSFLTRELVERLHERGRMVLGLHDPRDAAGRRRLLALDVDGILETIAQPSRILEHVRLLVTLVPDALPIEWA
ncbi:MAG: hypothetical protein R3249_00990 [Nitriliruptorales bacterium]|nr:hypothetical protein [Nitriliruptorales bacterium]